MGKFTAGVQEHLALPAQVGLTAGEEYFVGLSGRAIPAAIPVRFLIDTGTKRTTLAPSVLVQLNATAFRTVRVETSLAAGKTNLYWVRLEFPGSSLAPFSEMALAGLSLPASLYAYHGLIGRDLLRRWESCLYEGRRGRLTIRDVPPFWRRWLRW